MPKLSNGFTLVELLIVISIIGILSAIGLVTYQAVNRNARDSKRQADLKIIQGALEQYHADQFFYPASINFGSSNSITSCTGNLNCPSPTPAPPALKTYLNIVPQDPINNPVGYDYKGIPLGCDNDKASPPVELCTSYCLYSPYEGTPPTGPSSCTGTLPLKVGPP